MRFSLAFSLRSPVRTRLAHGCRWVVPLGIFLLCLISTGCSTKARPGVTCNVSIITPGNDGEFVPQGSPTRVESAPVNTEQKITQEGTTLSMLVRKTEYGKVTLDLTFPGLEPQRVRVGVGETKDVLPEGQKMGLRIEVLDCH